MRLYELNYETYRPTAVEPQVERQKVSLFRPFLKGEGRSLKTLLVRGLFWIQSKGDFRIYYVREDGNGKPIHTSYVTGASGKFPFMESGDIHIGPCITDPDHRGKGLYKQVLRTIHADNCTDRSRAFMIVHEDNLPSIKGIEAAGLTHVGTVERQGIRRSYRRVSDD